ncbi:MAG: DUF4347 domain-containing protein, partial [Chromatiaceae bacterium]|nr:DUF4347 domain-containing protein [Chromatiaceae bacterium]
MGSSKKKQKTRNRANPLIEALEPKLLFSADLFGAAVDGSGADDPVQALLDGSVALQPQTDTNPDDHLVVQSDAVTPYLLDESEYHSLIGTDDSNRLRSELVFVDPATPDYQQLLDDLLSREDDNRQIEVVLLEADRDGVAQIGDVLAGFRDLDAVHIISHGSDGAIRIGNSTLDQTTLNAASEEIRGWSQAFNVDGDLLIYGCDLASTAIGEQFIDRLSILTGADVAASDDLTGHQSLDGDWELEYRAGSIETASVPSRSVQSEWFATLATDVLTGSWSGVAPYSSTTTAASPVSVIASFTTPGNTDVQIMGTDSLTNQSFFSNASAEGWSSLDARIVWDSNPEMSTSSAQSDAGTATVTFTFDKVVTNPILHIDRLGGSASSQANSSEWTVTTAGATLTKLAGVGHFQVDADKFYRALVGTPNNNSEASADPNLGTAAGSVQINGTFTSLSFDVTGIGVEGTGADRLEMAWEVSASDTTPSDLAATFTDNGGLSLNNDGGNDAYVIADDGGSVLGGLSSFTLEMQFSSTQLATDSPLISYATGSTGDLSNELLGILTSDGYLKVHLAGENQIFSNFNFFSLNDGLRHSVALTWSNTSGDLEIFVDGQSKGGGTGLATGQTLDPGGALVFGQEQDSVDGDYMSTQTLKATLYDIRVFDDVRTGSEILSNYDSTLPYDEGGLLANWIFNNLSTNGVIVDAVSGNNLTVKHAAGGGFVPSTPEITFELNENALTGTAVGSIYGTDAEREARINALLAADANLTYSEMTGKFYKTVNSLTDWSSAKTAAESTTLAGVNGQLVTIRSAAENEIVQNLAQPLSGSVWLGATDQTVEGTWRWLSGGTDADQFWLGAETGGKYGASYQNWNATQPNDLGGVEDAARLDGSSGEWYDAPTTASNHYYVVEWNADEVLDATDALTYTIQSQTVSGAFAIDADSGRITVANGSLLDYETNATHTLTVRVTDVDGNSYDEAFTIQLHNQGGEPTQTLPGAQNVNEDGTLVFSTGNGNAVSVSDTGSADGRLQVTLTVTNGTLTLSQTTGLSFPGGSNGSASMVIQGGESDINAALQGMIYAPTGDYAGSANLQVTTAAAASLEGHYTFDAGNAVDDSVGVSQDGVLIDNATTVTDGTRGEVLSLDGTDDGVTISGRFGDPQNVTLAAWVNLNAADSEGAEVISLGDSVILRLDASSGGYGVIGSFREAGDWVDAKSFQFVAGDGWHHVAYSVDTTTNVQSLYIDGVVAAQTNSTSAVVYDLGSDTTIGKHGNGETTWDFDGKIDDARIYTRALSADEIAALAADQTSVTGNVLITVDAVNDIPIRTAGTLANLTVAEDSGLTSLGLGTVAYGPGGGADESSQTLTYSVTALPDSNIGDVVLADGTTKVTIGAYTLAQIQGMQFKTAADGSGVTAFQFNVTDSGGTDNGGVNSLSQFILITVNSTEDTPVAKPDTVHLVFDGDDFIQVADHASLQMTNNLTMEAWINHSGNGTGTQIILNKEGEYEVGITADTGEIKWAIADTVPTWAWHNTGHFVTAGEWTHVAVTYDAIAGEAKTYINGELVETFSRSGAIGDVYTQYDDLYIGGRQNAVTQRFDGQIDEVRVWNTTRTDIELQTNMNSLLSGAEAGLVGNWRLDEGSGVVSIDHSSFANNGLLGGAEGVSAAPVYQGYQTDQDSSLSITALSGVLANDFDGDNDALTATNLDTSTTLGLVTLNADGSFTYDPNGQFDYLAAGEHAIDTFTYTANDGKGDSNVATVTITITGVNDMPVASGNTVVALEDVPLVIGPSDFLFSDAEGDSLQSVTISGLNLNGGTLTHTGGTVTVTNGMTVTAAELTDLTFTSASNSSTDCSFSYTVNDSGSGVTSGTMNITVNPVTDLTVTDESFSTNEDTVLNADVSTNDSTTSGGSLSYALDTDVSNGTLVLNANGSFSYTPDA